MDELELLKKDWQKKDQDYPKLSYNEIYKMILKKSSSIVKWIFIISLLEFVFWAVISFALKDSKMLDGAQDLDMNSILIPASIISYTILIYFFYLFYKNFRNIIATDSTKRLMENILKTRRTVKQYVVFNISYLVIGIIFGVFYVLKNDENISFQIQKAASNGEIFKYYATIIIVTIIVLTIVVAVFLIFYWLVYGILLKRLNKNYRELKKMEV